VYAFFLLRVLQGNGYYFMRAGLGGGLLDYADHPQMKPVLLDPRPDATCLQDTYEKRKEDCSAYVELGIHTGFLAYYEGKLYTLEVQKVWTPDLQLIDVSKLQKPIGQRQRDLSAVVLTGADFAPKIIT
jgi:hypothetical protein